MSDISDSSNFEKTIHNEAPGWLRLMYIKEVFPKFVYPDSDKDPYEPPPSLIFINTLAEKLCIYYKTELPHAHREWEYVTEMIKGGDWKRFYGIVEFIGEVLRKYGDDLTESYLRFDEQQQMLREQNGDDSYDDSDLMYEMYNDDFSRMEIYGFQSYQTAVNSLFSENHVMYALADNGKLISLIDYQDVAQDWQASNLDKTIELLPQKQLTESVINDHTEKLLELIKNTDLLSEQYVNTIETGVGLFSERKYHETMQILYPSIEYVLNSMLRKAGEEPESYRGFRDKVKWLENSKLLPPHSAEITMLIEGRNKTAHGNLNIEDEGLAEAICSTIIAYLCFLVRPR